MRTTLPDSHTSKVLINCEKAIFAIDGKDRICWCDTVIDFLPTPSIYFFVKEIRKRKRWFGFYNFGGLGNKIKFPERRSEDIDVLVLSCSDYIKLSPRYSRVKLPKNVVHNIHMVDFYLVNFIDYMSDKGKPQKIGTAYHNLQCLLLKHDNWIIEISSCPNTSDAFNKLQESGGHTATHIGIIKREDGSAFDSVSAEKILNALRYFLSFLRGFRVSIFYPKGYDRYGVEVWQSLNSPRGVAWTNVLSWFDSQAVMHDLQSMFSKYMEMVEDEELWGYRLEEIMELYLSANLSSRGIETGIILSQAAVEMISYTYAVINKKLLLSEAFKKLEASNQFRLLFSSLNISLEIPDCLSQLVIFLKENKNRWEDAPFALTDIRNSIVHPDHKLKRKIDSIKFETWNLFLWYIEVVLLKLLNYNGMYNNRLLVPVGKQYHQRFPA